MNQEIERIYSEDWKEAILCDSDDEAIVLGMGLKLVNMIGRRFLWRFCHKVAENKNGVPGCACRILERYLSHINLKTKYTTNVNEKKQLMYKLRKEIRVLAMCSVFIAAKMNGKRPYNTASIVCKSARLYGYINNISVKDVNKIEMDIMKAIDFKLPVWTGVDTALMLAAEVSLGETEAVFLLMDYAEYKLKKINCIYKNATHNHNTCSIRTIHLAAAAVSAIAYYMLPGRKEEITNMVANLTDTTPAKISRLKDAIISVVGHPNSIQVLSSDSDSDDSDYF